MKKIALLVFVIVFIAAPVFATSMEKINQLKPEMTTDEVRKLLGNPNETQFINDKLMWRYPVFQFFVGSMPYYLVFNKDTLKLEAWFKDEAEYWRNQQAWTGVAGSMNKGRVAYTPQQATPQPQLIIPQRGSRSGYKSVDGTLTSKGNGKYDFDGTVR